jgi:hypothetical protein
MYEMQARIGSGSCCYTTVLSLYIFLLDGQGNVLDGYCLSLLIVEKYSLEVRVLQRTTFVLRDRKANDVEAQFCVAEMMARHQKSNQISIRTDGSSARNT